MKDRAKLKNHLFDPYQIKHNIEKYKEFEKVNVIGFLRQMPFGASSLDNNVCRWALLALERGCAISNATK